MMRLNIKVQRAVSFKRIVQLVSGIHPLGLLSIHQDGLLLRVMNPLHLVPAAVILLSSWFQTYTLDVIGDHPFYSCWTISFNLEVLNEVLGSAKDDEQLQIQICLGNDQVSTGFFFIFNDQNSMQYVHRMEFQRTDLDFVWTDFLILEHLYGFGFRVVMPPDRFLHILQCSMESQQSMIIEITSSSITMSSEETTCSLYPDPYCLIQNFPTHALFFFLQCALHKAHYFIEAARMGRTMGILVGNRVHNPELAPVLEVLIEQSATIYFFLERNSIVNSQFEQYIP